MYKAYYTTLRHEVQKDQAKGHAIRHEYLPLIPPPVHPQ